jgi:hypothetical protein
MPQTLINKGFNSAPTKLFFAKVIGFNAVSNTVDVATIDNNTYIYDCMILCSKPASFNFGEKYIPTFEADIETSYVMSPGDIYCVAGYIGDYHNTIVLGFLFSNQTELSIPEYGLYIFRHESDVVLFIRSDGTMELYHPSGSYIKFGTDDVNYVDDQIEEGGLYPSSASGFRLRKPDEFNATKQMGLFINWWAGQKISLDKDGNIELQTNPSKQVNVVVSGGTVNITANQINFIKG